MNKQVLTSILEAFPKQRVLVLGDVMLDEYLYGEARRISPEAPVPVVEFQFRADSLGGAANVAANVADLGGQVLVGGLVGNDEPAQRLRDVLRCRRIDGAGLVVDSDRPTTLKTRVLGPCQQIVRIDRERRDRIGPAQENRLLAWVEESLPSVDACVLSDYGKGVVSERLGHGLIRMAPPGRQAGGCRPQGGGRDPLPRGYFGQAELGRSGAIRWAPDRGRCRPARVGPAAGRIAGRDRRVDYAGPAGDVAVPFQGRCVAYSGRSTQRVRRDGGGRYGHCYPRYGLGRWCSPGRGGRVGQPGSGNRRRQTGHCNGLTRGIVDRLLSDDRPSSCCRVLALYPLGSPVGLASEAPCRRGCVAVQLTAA